MSANPDPVLISVIICTHNPREDYLRRTLDALKNQTLPDDQWELLLIDNASQEPLAKKWDLSWHPRGLHVREDELGLTPARLRGIREAAGELLVFVDDDNVLSLDYLARVVELAGVHPNLGAWSGQVLPEFEMTPAVEITPFLNVLCIRKLARDAWSNHSDPSQLPYGAGMCVRKNVAEHYATEVGQSNQRINLDRKGTCLASSGDLDLCLTSVDLGLGTGLFHSLVVTHLIPARRLDRDYILRLIEDSSMGHYIFETSRNIPHPPKPSGIDKLVSRYKLLRASPMQKAVNAARQRGLRRAQAMLAANA